MLAAVALCTASTAWTSHTGFFLPQVSDESHLALRTINQTKLEMLLQASGGGEA